jgi:hypothetical protein
MPLRYIPTYLDLATMRLMTHPVIASPDQTADYLVAYMVNRLVDAMSREGWPLQVAATVVKSDLNADLHGAIDRLALVLQDNPAFLTTVVTELWLARMTIFNPN